MINIKETFLALTKRRYPKGDEDLAMEIVKSILPNVNFTKDEFANYYTYITKSDGSDSEVKETEENIPANLEGKTADEILTEAREQALKKEKKALRNKPDTSETDFDMDALIEQYDYRRISHG